MRTSPGDRRSGVVSIFTALLVVMTALAAPALLTARGTAAQDDTEPVTLKILGLTEANADFVDYAVQEFEQRNPNVTIEINVQPDINGAESSIKAAFASGDVPDLAYMYEGGSRAPLFARQGLLLPLNDYIANDPDFDVEDIAQGLMGTATVGDQIYGVPFFQVALVYIWNKSVLAEAGLTEPPKTGDEVVAMCQALAAKGLTFDPAVGVGGWGGNAFHWANDTGFVKVEDGKAIANVTDPKFVEGIKWLWDLVHTHKCWPPATTDLQAYPNDTRMADFKAGKTVALWGLPSTQYDDLVGKDNWVAAPRWAMNDRPFNVVGGMHAFIPKDAANPDWAWKFVSFYLSPELQEINATEFNGLPQRLSLLQRPEIANNPYIAPVLAAMSTENRAAPWDVPGAEAAVGVWALEYQPKVLQEPDWTKAQALFEEANEKMQAEIDKAETLGG